MENLPKVQPDRHEVQGTRGDAVAVDLPLVLGVRALLLNVSMEVRHETETGT
jgi:hypothetical protein